MHCSSTPSGSTICQDIDIYCCDSVNGIGDWLDPNLEVIVFPNPFSDGTNVRLSQHLNEGLWFYSIHLAELFIKIRLAEKELQSLEKDCRKAFMH
jgi:hypothetical protein